MATTPKAAAIEHVWGALVTLIEELTRLAKSAADQLEEENKKPGGRR